jgi:hypothetical protein
VPDRRHQVEQVGVRLGDLLGEELDDADDAALRGDRERERPVHAALGRDARAGEVGVVDHVPDPGRLGLGPHAAG